MRSNQEIVLRAISLGIPVTLGNDNYKLFKPGEDIYSYYCGELDLCTVTRKLIFMEYPQNSGSYIESNLTLLEFLNLCEKLTFEEVAMIGASTVLTEMNLEKIRKF